jgi:hypothetical protein
MKTTLPNALNNRSAKTVMLISCLLLAFGSVALTSNYTAPESNFTFVPLNLKNHSAITSVNPSDLFFVENASGVEGNMDGAVSTLL